MLPEHVAMASGKEVMIHYFEKNHNEELIAIIHDFDMLKKEFCLVDQSGSAYMILIESTDQINIVNEV